MIVTLGLSACRSGADEPSVSAVDRQAFGLRDVEMCISREASAGPMTVTWRGVKPKASVELDASPVPESQRSPDEGPFTLDYVSCRTSSSPRGLHVADANGTRVLWVGASNPSANYPAVTVESLVDGTDEVHGFSEGESYTFDAGGYAVRVKREEDSSDSKHFRIWVGRP